MFYVKDIITKKMLLSSQNNDGLYVLFESSATSILQDYWSSYIFATTDIWHRQLGHLTSSILNFLVFKNKIVCTSRHSLTQCQVCPLSKSLLCRWDLWVTKLLPHLI
jgi:hypothetical protein